MTTVVERLLERTLVRNVLLAGVVGGVGVLLVYLPATTPSPTSASSPPTSASPSA